MEYSDLRDMCVFVRKEAGMTSLEYFSTPESVLPTELTFGELVVRDSPSSSHQAVVGSFFVVRREHVRARAWGRVGRTARCRAGRGWGSIGSRHMVSKNAGPVTSRNNCWKSSRLQTLEWIGG
jgi:hypothetical protein